MLAILQLTYTVIPKTRRSAPYDNIAVRDRNRTGFVFTTRATKQEHRRQAK